MGTKDKIPPYSSNLFRYNALIKEFLSIQNKLFNHLFHDSAMKR